MNSPVTASRRPLAVALVAALGLALVVPAAQAGDHGKRSKWYDDDRREWDGRDDYDWAKVVDVDPIVRRIRVEEPRRECWDETRYEPGRVRREGTSTAGGMILGGIIGGAIGNQIGRGDGRRAATVAGAIIGSAIGHDTAERRGPPRTYEEPGREYTVEKCDVRYETRWDERVEGYDVEYVYNGRSYHTRLPYDPGEKLRIRVGVQPAEG